jgi:hypothetical protein
VISDWRTRAACRYVDPTLFDRPEVSGRKVPKSAQFAASYCENCPVRDECGAEADDNRDEGVRGGTWRANTSHGYRSYEITPLTSKAIRVINHDQPAVRVPRRASTNPERAAS